MNYQEAIAVKERISSWEQNFHYIYNAYDVETFLKNFKNDRQMKAFCKRCKFHILTPDNDYKYEDFLEAAYENLYDLLFYFPECVAGKIRIQMPKTKTLMSGYHSCSSKK